jgi:hypothetical protein
LIVIKTDEAGIEERKPCNSVFLLQSVKNFVPAILKALEIERTHKLVED